MACRRLHSFRLHAEQLLGVMTMKNISAIAGAALAGLILTGGAANAQINPQLFTDVNTGSTLANPPFTLGWEFSTNNAIRVNALGFFDDSQDGLAKSHEVGLWDSLGNLLAETTVVTGDPLVNQWRYSDVTPVTLAAGADYFVGALFTSGADNVVFTGSGAGVTTTANISYVQATFAGGGSLSDPTNADGTPGFFGPNISANTVPESSTWAMMTLGFAGLGFAGWRKTKGQAAFAG
jgi:hypothetical protein